MSREDFPPKIRKFPIGPSSFARLVERDNDNNFRHYFVDKTLSIRDLLDNNSEILLLPRFRRSGKSTFLDMVARFCDIRHKETNEKLFRGLKIENALLANQEPCMKYQGQNPVICLDFKNLSQSNFNEMYESFKAVISKLYQTHEYLLDSSKLNEFQKEKIRAIYSEKANDATYKTALEFLMRCLSQHYNGKKVVVLIDEYDAPFQKAIHHDLYGRETPDISYLTQLKDLFGVFLGEALKGNDDYLERCVMTGIVRISGLGLFSQLNNLKVYTIFDKPFSDCFGFTQPEVEQLVEEAFSNHPQKREFLAALVKWYNGYRFGDTVIYNSWSVINACDDLMAGNIRNIDHLNSYWLGTSTNELIRDRLLHPKSVREECEVNEFLAQVISGETPQKVISPDLIFDDKVESTEHLWVLLISQGYLNVVSREYTPNEQFSCTLAIPNLEVRTLYLRVICEWANSRGIPDNSPLIEHLLQGNAEAFCKALEDFFKAVVSVRDTAEKKVSKKAKKPEDEDESFEAYYHGFMVGILGLSLNSRYHKAFLTSNRESGYGYYDLQLEPVNPQDAHYNKAVIFEFKRCTDEKQLENEAKAALKKIQQKQYETTLKERGIKTIVLIGVAFHKKKIKYQFKTLSTEELNYKQPLQVQANLLPLPSPSSGSAKATINLPITQFFSAQPAAAAPEPEKKKPKTDDLHTKAEEATSQPSGGSSFTKKQKK